jgi:hypothetical protein
VLGKHDSPVVRVSAKWLDAAVGEVVAKSLAEQKGEVELCKNRDPQTRHELSVQFTELEDRLNSGSTALVRELFRSLNLRIRIELYGPSMTLFGSMILPDGQNCEPRSLDVAVVLDRKSFGKEARVRVDPASPDNKAADERLVALIARSFAARDRLSAMVLEEVQGISPTHVRHLERIARLSYLDPHIIRAIETGKNPKHLTARYLSRMASLPILWIDQRKVLGF